MTRKHFTRSATILGLRLARARTEAEQQLVWGLVADFADWFKQENPAFDRGKFVAHFLHTANENGYVQA